jgi:hypothetical protein
MTDSRSERWALRAKFPAEYDDGARAAVGIKSTPHDASGYPLGFHDWTLERRNAWLAGFNAAFSKRGTASSTEELQ